MFKINFSVNGVKKYIEPDMVWWNKYWKYAAIGVVIVVFFVAIK